MPKVLACRKNFAMDVYQKTFTRKRRPHRTLQQSLEFFIQKAARDPGRARAVRGINAKASIHRRSAYNIERANQRPGKQDSRRLPRRVCPLNIVSRAARLFRSNRSQDVRNSCLRTPRCISLWAALPPRMDLAPAELMLATGLPTNYGVRVGTPTRSLRATHHGEQVFITKPSTHRLKRS